jgi:hypothetical protein
VDADDGLENLAIVTDVGGGGLHLQSERT